MTKPNAKEKKYLSRVAALGCIICGRPAECHHLTSAGMALKASHYDTIPLCPEHHRTGNHGVAIHAGTIAWEKKFGFQKELLKRTKMILGQAE